MLESTNILEQQRNSDIMSCDPNLLVDLREVKIDTSLPVQKRMEQFLLQVGNPYLFRVDGIVVKASYLPQANRRLSDALPGLLIP
ncbi:MAG: hypothetical protein IKU31_05990 [Oscillospiraceae bacterium]|nr:hypothetical protein [Oscillospiraceae bacterium]